MLKKSVKINNSVKIEEREQCEINDVKVLRKSAILRNADVLAYYKNIFDNCDINKDGLINISELKEFIANQEEDISEEVIRSLHSCFDQNKDNQLDFHEFLDMINHPTVTRTFKRIGSRYLKFVVSSSVRTKSLKLRRTVTDTGLYEEEIVFKKHTIGMLLLSAVQIMFFYVDMACTGNPIEEALEFDPERRYQIWRFVTYMLVHDSCIHLYANVLIQLLIGVPLELVHCWRVPVIYVAGAFGGCLAHSVLNKTELVGGSGGMYAFYTAHIATVILNWKEMSHPVVHLIIFGILTIFDAIFNYIRVYVVKTSNVVSVSYITHLGGTVVGLLLGVNILRNLKVTKVEKIVWCVSATVLVVLLIIFITWNIIITLNCVVDI